MTYFRTVFFQIASMLLSLQMHVIQDIGVGRVEMSTLGGLKFQPPGGLKFASFGVEVFFKKLYFYLTKLYFYLTNLKKLNFYFWNFT